MNALVTFRLCKLSDEDLLKKVNEGIDNLYIDGKIPARNIPARPDEDFDLLVGELIMRFKERDTTLTCTAQPDRDKEGKEVEALKMCVTAIKKNLPERIAVDDEKQIQLYYAYHNAKEVLQGHP